MIFGVGTDVCDSRRIRAVLGRRGERFAERVLGRHELEVFRARRGQLEERGVRYLATRFSAKEAFSKAIGETIGARIPGTVEQLIAEGALGRKTGRGFHTYET